MANEPLISLLWAKGWGRGKHSSRKGAKERNRAEAVESQVVAPSPQESGGCSWVAPSELAAWGLGEKAQRQLTRQNPSSVNTGRCDYYSCQSQHPQRCELQGAVGEVSSVGQSIESEGLGTGKGPGEL